MKLSHWSLLILIGMLGVFAMFYVVKERPSRESTEEVAGEVVKSVVLEGHGVRHPEFPAMSVGGDGVERSAHILWLGWVFGLLQVAFFTFSIALGAYKKDVGVGTLKIPLIFGGLVYAGAWTALILTYRTYMNETEHALIWAFPLPTVVMLGPLAAAPIIFLVYYVIGFKRWIYSPEDAEKFRQLVEARRAREEESS